MGADSVAVCDRCCSCTRSATWTMVWWWLALAAQARAPRGEFFWKLLNALRASRVSPTSLIPKPFPKRRCTEFSILTRGNGRMVCLHTFWGKEQYLRFVCKSLFFVTFASFLCDRLGIDTQWRTERGGLGCSNPPPKFRRYRRSPWSHEQLEPASRFPFAVHCVLIRL